MTTPESLPVRTPEEIARDYCAHVMRALHLFYELSKSPQSDELRFRAEQAAESVINNSTHEGMRAMTGGVPFQMYVTIPEAEGIRAETSRYHEPLDLDPKEFLADEVQRVNSEQIDFFNRKDFLWLVAYENRHKIHIEPVFPVE